jgi:hypothetical protein
MLQLSLDGKRLYVTTSLFSPWDLQFYRKEKKYNRKRRRDEKKGKKKEEEGKEILSCIIFSFFLFTFFLLFSYNEATRCSITPR